MPSCTGEDTESVEYDIASRGRETFYLEDDSGGEPYMMILGGFDERWYIGNSWIDGTNNLTFNTLRDAMTFCVFAVAQDRMIAYLEDRLEASVSCGKGRDDLIDGLVEAMRDIDEIIVKKKTASKPRRIEKDTEECRRGIVRVANDLTSRIEVAKKTSDLIRRGGDRDGVSPSVMNRNSDIDHPFVKLRCDRSDEDEKLCNDYWGSVTGSMDE
ncbi:MAG: hypothetical protein ABIH41_01440 [Nanoarchaeota archaeon]